MSIISVNVLSIAIIVGALPLLFLPQLPPFSILLLLVVIALGLLFIRTRLAIAISLLLFAFVWSCYSGYNSLTKIENLADKTVTVVGEIISIGISVTEKPPMIRFKITEMEDNSGKLKKLNNQKIQLLLRWPGFDNEKIKAGQYWRLHTAIRPVHSRLNQGGFDSQRYAIANGLGLVGIVKQATLLKESINFRQRLLDSTQQIIGSLDNFDILMALAFGERGAISAERKLLLLHSGIAHLIAISGLHISLAACIGWGAGRFCQFFFPQRLIEPYFPRVLSLVFAASYVWLSGANAPAMRALIALCFWLYLRWRGYLWGRWQIWLSTIALLIVMDPLIILSESAWLSCVAVACLLFWFQLAPLTAKLQQKRYLLLQWSHLQIGITVLLLPLQIAIFHGMSMNSVLSNLVAVPVISFLTIPLVLLGLITLVFESINPFLWLVADSTLAFVFIILNKIPQQLIMIKQEYIIFSFLGWLALLIWRLSLWRISPVLLVIIVLVIILPRWNNKKYIWRVDMLDIGHGLAMVIHNGQQSIIYDTGNQWQDSSMAVLEILPFLRWQGLTVEGIIVSHQDNDHAGGLKQLQKAFPNSWLMSSSSSLTGRTCIQGGNFNWRGLKFDMIWPLKTVERAYNPHSCVIKVSDEVHSLLLTGDLESEQELQLVRQLGEQLQSDILQVPHHGSKTSSSGPFLRAVQPKIALVSAARFNPWRLPAQKIRQRYQKSEINLYSTAQEGQISVLFFKDNFEIHSYRRDIVPRWYHHWFGSTLYNE